MLTPLYCREWSGGRPFLLQGGGGQADVGGLASWSWACGRKSLPEGAGALRVRPGNLSGSTFEENPLASHQVPQGRPVERNPQDKPESRVDHARDSCVTATAGPRRPRGHRSPVLPLMGSRTLGKLLCLLYSVK